MQIARRSFLFGAGAGASLIAAPAIVRAASLMPVKPVNFLRFGHRAADPVMLNIGDGIGVWCSYTIIDVGRIIQINDPPGRWIRAA